MTNLTTGAVSTISEEKAFALPLSTTSTSALARDPKRTKKENSRRIPSGRGALEISLIEQAIDLTENIDLSAPQDLALGLASLAAAISQLWESALSASEFHTQILAAIDNAAIALANGESPSAERLAGIREGLIDLKLPLLTQANVDTINSRLIDLDFSPSRGIEDINQDV